MFAAERIAGFVQGLLEEVVVTPLAGDSRRLSDRIDRVLVHRLLGLPVFAAIMYGIFWVTFTLAIAAGAWWHLLGIKENGLIGYIKAIVPSGLPVPLIPFLFGLQASGLVATVMTSVVFFLIGSAKSRWSTQNWILSGLETTVIGMIAAGLAFMIGWALQGLI